MHQKNISFREAVIGLGQQYQIEITLENEGQKNYAQEKLQAVLKKAESLQIKLLNLYDESEHSISGIKIKQFWPETGFLKDASLLSEVGYTEKISLPHDHQGAFYSIPYQNERGDIFGFYFICLEDEPQMELPIEKYTFSIFFSDRFQPILNFPRARKNIKSKDLIATTNLFDACFLIKNSIENVVLVQKQHITDGFFSHLSKYINKLYLILPDQNNYNFVTEKLKILIRWVPLQLSDRIKAYRLLNSNIIPSWLLSSEKQSRHDCVENQSSNNKKVSKKSTEKTNKIFFKTSRFYHQILLQESYSHVMQYLEGRGFNKDDVTEWSLGFCPRESALTNSIIKHSMDINAFESVGILRFSQKNNRYYDFFYNRVIIPILNHNGDFVGLGGRIIDSQDTTSPKYINSSESVLFSKSKILFNFYKASNAIVEKEFVIVVEGFLDCITLVKNGIYNTVAVMGTALTEDHLKALSQITKRVVLCFDTDSAGRLAIQKSFMANFKFQNLQLEILNLPDEKDPDAFVRKYGSNQFQSLIEAGTSPIEISVFETIESESSDNDEFFDKLKLMFKHVEMQEHGRLTQSVASFLNHKYQISINSICQCVTESKALNEAPNRLTSEAIEDFNAPIWSLKNALEIKVLFLFFYIDIHELPNKFKNVLLDIPQEDEAGLLFADAYHHQISEIGQSILTELLTYCLNQNYGSCTQIKEHELSNFSMETGIFIAFIQKYSTFLIKESVTYLIENIESIGLKTTSAFDITNVWSSKNRFFLNLQRKNVELGHKFNTHLATLIEFLTRLEIDEIDSQLKLYSRTHFDHEISEKFDHLMQARSVRHLLLIGCQR